MNYIHLDTELIQTLPLTPISLPETGRSFRSMAVSELPVTSLVQTQVREPDCRHWCPRSQVIAPADVLLGYLRSGWQVSDRVLVEVHRFGSYRRTELFYFTLTSGRDRICMPVLSNPVVMRLVDELGVEVVRVHTEPEDKRV